MSTLHVDFIALYMAIYIAVCDVTLSYEGTFNTFVIHTTPFSLHEGIYPGKSVSITTFPKASICDTYDNMST